MKHSTLFVVAVLACLQSDAVNVFAAPGATRNVVAKTEKEIQKAIDSLNAPGGTVVIRAFKQLPVVINKSILINRDNVTLRGEGGVILRLANGAQAPVIIMGSDAATPSVTRRNIHVSDLIIDGNRTNQASELNPANPALRNNGVSVRRVSDSSVSRLAIHSCRSGGLVTELVCRRLTISDVESFNHHFDGIAGYQTEDSLFTRLQIHDNLAAGFSFDIEFDGNLLTDSVLDNNGSVGMFIRDSRDNVFANFQIRDSGQHGIFLAQVDADTTKPALGNTFYGCVIADSAGAGIRVNDASCTANLLVASQLVNNAGGGISEAVAGLLIAVGNVER